LREVFLKNETPIARDLISIAPNFKYINYLRLATSLVS
jgi:hypothetical protein